MMPPILVATDFSPAGDNAVYYAAALAESQGAELVALHAYFMPVTFNDPAIPIIPITDLKDANQTRMDRLSTGLRQAFPGLYLSARVEYGDIEDTLGDVIEEIKPQLLVIGAHAEAEESFFIGSRSGELLRRSKTAMLAVPEGYAYKPVEKLCVGVDKNGMTADAAFNALHGLLALHSATLDILHVTKEEAVNPELTEIISLPTFRGASEVRLKVVGTSGSVDDEIATFIAASGMDWLVVIPHHYSFWESLFHKSHTKALVHKAGIPVLALH